MKKSLILISILLLVCFLPINTFGECIKGDCVNGQGTYIFSYKNDKPQKWIYTYPKGTKYVGEWKDGKPHGQGVLTLPNGRKKVGEWIYGEFYK